MIYEISYYYPDYLEGDGFVVTEAVAEFRAVNGWDAVEMFIEKFGIRDATLITSINRLRIDLENFEEVEIFPSRETALKMVDWLLSRFDPRIKELRVENANDKEFLELKSFLDEI